MKRDINLMYHDVYVGSPSESGFDHVGGNLYKVTRENFELQLQESAKVENVRYVFTFDDGGISFIHQIAPLLEKYGQKGIFFVTTEEIGHKGFMKAEQIVELEKRGHIIGSHGHTHIEQTKLDADGICEQWRKSQEILTSILGHPVKIASIPHGAYNSNVIRLAKENGFLEIYTSDPCSGKRTQGSISIYGRYVVMGSSKAEHILRLQKTTYRSYLYMRFLILQTLQFVLGAYYKSFRDRIFSK